MGKAGKWLRSLLPGKKNKEKTREKCQNQVSSLPTESTAVKEKRRWSFRRSAAPGKESSMLEQLAPTSAHGFPETKTDQERHAVAVAIATAAAADAAVAAAQAAAAVIRLTSTAAAKRTGTAKEAAAIKIQSIFRSYLARKALYALRGLVKLQALVRGHLIRRQAKATLRCMQALVAAQARARAQRMQMLDEEKSKSLKQPLDRRCSQQPRHKQPHVETMDGRSQENVKIVEIDVEETRSTSNGRHSYSATRSERNNHNHGPPKIDACQKVSPTPSALTDYSPRTQSGHLEEFSFTTAQSSSPRCQAACHDLPLFPSYMANTESSRAKARSQSAPKQRPDSFEQQPNRRRSSLEGKHSANGVRMHRSSSNVGAPPGGYQYPTSVKLDKFNASLNNSECGSTSTMLTNTTYRSALEYDYSRVL